MAAGAACKVRYLTDADTHLRISPFIKSKISDGKLFGEFHMRMTGTAAATKTEISAPTAVFDGTTTPIVVYVISTSATDTDADGGAVKAVKIIGISSTDLITVETVRMNGITQVATTTLWKRLIHVYACEWGTAGDDAAGTITVTNTGQSATYLTIGANANDSDNFTLWLPANYAVQINRARLAITTQNNAAYSVQVYVDYYNVEGYGADPDFSEYILHANHQSPVDDEIFSNETHDTDSGAKAVFSTQYLGGGAENFDLSLSILVWQPYTSSNTRN